MVENEPVRVSEPDITVSIVSYNTRDLLRACVASLEARAVEGEATLEIVIADNGSRDGTVEMLRSEFRNVQVIETGGNVGYGVGNNIALADARGRYFLVLNSDTEVEPGALATMRDFLDARPEVGMAAPRLILPDGTTQASCARDPDLLSVFLEQSYLSKLLPHNPLTGRYFMTYWDYNDTREVEQVAGACLCVRREAYRQIGGFDPAYFMYFEDTDFCMRLRRAGWPLYYLHNARVRHHLGGSSGRDWRTGAWMIACYNQSRYYHYRSQSRGRGLALKALVLMGAGLRLAGWSVAALLRPSARNQVRLFHDVWRRTWRMISTPERTP